MTEPEQLSDLRSAAAFRRAVDDWPTAGVVDPVRARRTARRQRTQRLVVGATAVAVVLAGAVVLPRVLERPEVAAVAPVSAPPAALPTDPAPTGWRTEYYRDLSFAVPASWRYAYEPGSAWCAGGSSTTPSPERRRPYVSLGGPSLVPMIACPELPESLLTEHVATTGRFAGDAEVSGTTRRGDWLVAKQVFDHAVLVVTTRDPELARSIIASVAPATGDAPCPATSPVQGPRGARPATGFALAGVTGVRQVSICQYDPEPVPGDPLAGLKARRALTGTPAVAFVDQLAAAPTTTRDCAPDPDFTEPELAVVVQVWTDTDRYQVFVQATGCDDGVLMDGGIDDGQTVRRLTRAVCRDLLVAPIALEGASGALADNCLT